MIGHHAIAELFHIGALAILGRHFAHLDFHHSAFSGVHHESFVRRAQLASGFGLTRSRGRFDIRISAGSEWWISVESAAAGSEGESSDCQGRDRDSFGDAINFHKFVQVNRMPLRALEVRMFSYGWM